MARLPAMPIALTAVAALASFVVSSLAAPSLPPYTNHTVGGNFGWFFNAATNTSATNYTAWTAAKTFNLGDYLVFNTNTNMTLVQTYNATTYNLCSADQDDSNETFVYADDGNVGFGIPATLAVPLTVEGLNYFFSDAGDDTVQCLKGMRFQIKVDHGQGLPPDLMQPPPPPPGAAAPPTSTTGPGGGGDKGKVTDSNWAVSRPRAGLWRIVSGVTVGLLLV